MFSCSTLPMLSRRRPRRTSPLPRCSACRSSPCRIWKIRAGVRPAASRSRRKRGWRSPCRRRSRFCRRRWTTLRRAATPSSCAVRAFVSCRQYTQHFRALLTSEPPKRFLKPVCPGTTIVLDAPLRVDTRTFLALECAGGAAPPGGAPPLPCILDGARVQSDRPLVRITSSESVVRIHGLKLTVRRRRSNESTVLTRRRQLGWDHDSAAVSSAPGALVLMTACTSSRAPSPPAPVSRRFSVALDPPSVDVGDGSYGCRQVGAVATSLRGRLRAVLCTQVDKVDPFCGFWNCDH